MKGIMYYALALAFYVGALATTGLVSAMLFAWCCYALLLGICDGQTGVLALFHYWKNYFSLLMKGRK